MSGGHELVEQVYAAKTDSDAADALIRQYMGFIRAEAAKFLHRAPVEGQDEERLDDDREHQRDAQQQDRLLPQRKLLALAPAGLLLRFVLGATTHRVILRLLIQTRRPRFLTR